MTLTLETTDLQVRLRLADDWFTVCDLSALLPGRGVAGPTLRSRFGGGGAGGGLGGLVGGTSRSDVGSGGGGVHGHDVERGEPLHTRTR